MVHRDGKAAAGDNLWRASIVVAVVFSSYAAEPPSLLGTDAPHGQPALGTTAPLDCFWARRILTKLSIIIVILFAIRQLQVIPQIFYSTSRCLCS